ncbi:MAG: hypothetical protein A9957_04165 [Methanohalophilus sp. DAL1]|nr:MAG: hypothetical protein A9957_04165 [Methanohalophilus sp. DAL1]
MHQKLLEYFWVIYASGSIRLLKTGQSQFTSLTSVFRTGLNCCSAIIPFLPGPPDLQHLLCLASITVSSNSLALQPVGQHIDLPEILYRSLMGQVHGLGNSIILVAGTDISLGETVLEAGQMLSPAKIGILAALGINNTIVKNLKVGIISTGNELTEPGNPLSPGMVYDANSYTLSAAIRRLSATPVAYGIVGDEPEKARSLLLKAVSECDIVLTTGSTSAGSDDFMHRLMEEEGQIRMHGLRFKPGKPVIIASVRNIPVIGLPGNPTASLMVFNEIVSLLVRKGLGIAAPARQRMKATLMDDVYSDNRLEYHCVEVIDGCAHSVDKTSASITTLAKADGFIVIEPETTFVKAGNEVEVTFFEN